jgi:hypothetical protein
MAETPIAPKQSAPSAASDTELYDCPDSTTFVGNLYAANRSSTPTAIRVWIEIDNAATDDKQYLAYDAPIGPNEVIRFKGITLSADDRVNVRNTLATVSFNLMGIEKT